MRVQNNLSLAAILSPVILLSLLSLNALAQAPPTALELGKPIEHQIKGGETHSFQFPVKAGHYARVEVEQKNIDVIVSLFAPDGKLVVEMDGKERRIWREILSYIAETEGLVRVDVKAYGAADFVASSQIKLAETRLSDPADRKELEAQAHLQKGRTLYEQGAPKAVEAAKEFEAAAAIFRERQDAVGELTAQFNAGLAFSSSSNREQALNAFNRALELSVQTRDRNGEGKAANGIGGQYYGQGKDDKAIEFLNRALDIRVAIHDRRGEMGTLNNLGLLNLRAQRYEKGVHFLERSLALARELKDRTQELQTLFSIGNAHFFHAVKLTVYQQFLQGARMLKHNPAEDYSSQALLLARELRDRRSEARVLGLIGGIHAMNSEYENALAHYEQALAIYRDQKNLMGQLATLYSIGNNNRSLGRMARAVDYYLEAVSIARNISGSRLETGASFASQFETDALTSIAHTYSAVGNNPKARDYYEKALEKAEGDKSYATHSSFMIPDLYRQLQRYDKALEYYSRSLDSARSKGDHGQMVVLFELMASMYSEQSKFEEARKTLEDALALTKEKNLTNQEPNVLISLGNLYRTQKQFSKAQSYFEMVLADFGKSDTRNHLTHKLLGDLFIEMKRFEDARKHLETVYIAQNENSGIDFAFLAASMADLNIGLGRRATAIYFAKQEVNIYQLVREGLNTLDEATRRAYTREKEPAYRRLADLLISEGRLPEAQAVLNLLKEEEFRNYTIQRSRKTQETVPYSKTEASVVAKVEQLAKLEREKGELLKQEQGPLRADKRTRLDAIATEIEAANRAFRLALEDLGRTESSSANRIAEIGDDRGFQRTLFVLEKETGSAAVALYTVLGTEDSKVNSGGQKQKTKFGWIIRVTPDGRKAYPIDVSDLEQIVFQLREALQSDKYDPKPLAQKLYQKLFRQTSQRQKTTLEDDLETLLGAEKEKTLMWSLDGILRYVPMAALHDGKQYLVEKYRHQVFTKESFHTLTEKDVGKWSALGLGVSEQQEGFSALPGVERELKDVVRDANNGTGVLDGSIRLNKDFGKESTFGLWREGKFPVIHIASHYVFHPTDPTSSFLLVGDGKMSFAEMQDKDNLFGTVDLLTLSACDTALTGNGKEAEGFAYLAQSLGAKSVIASLWKVSDAGTPDLMIRFYKLRSGNSTMTKGEAFRRAQVSLLYGNSDGNNQNAVGPRSEIVSVRGKKDELPLFVKDEKRPFAHPHYWSSFVLIGNWR